MLFYFSATGNSRWVARRLAAETGEELFDITTFLKENRLPVVTGDVERVGVVFPIHSWYVPSPVLDFLSQIAVPASVYRYAVCTCGDDAGKALSRLSHRFPLDAAWSVQMSNTYVPMFCLDAPELARQKVENARERLSRMAEAVKHRERVWDVCEGSWAWCKTYAIYPLFKRFCIGTRAFRVNEGCISCGRCEQHCPVSAIHLTDGRPVWSDACIHCMACLHGCPTHAICYGKGTEKKGQYRLEDYL